ncbi:cation transporter dimerization domain-containing protein [Clostridium sp. WILCCON 0269]|uniref:Cation transporter dimerization domain-containing protein n=1 Tax=Candidatus Clostridium eludens TaxID=3381663 RepID=A0ABW8SIW2_9CLOT
MSGAKKEIDIHIQLSNQIALDKAHEITNSIENEIKSVFPNSYSVVHIEPKR